MDCGFVVVDCVLVEDLFMSSDFILSILVTFYIIHLLKKIHWTYKRHDGEEKRRGNSSKFVLISSVKYTMCAL